MSLNVGRYLDDISREAWQGLAAPLVHQGKFPTPAPTTMVFVVAHRCNSRCQMCNIWQSKNPPEITVDQVQGIFSRNDFSSLRLVSLTGGEATLRSDLPELLGAVLEGAPNVEYLRLATHGMMPHRVSDQVERCWEVARSAGISRFTIQVSLDGIGDVHDRIRGIKGGFGRVQETLDYLINLRRRAPAISIALSTVVQTTNKENIEQLQSFARGLNIPIYFSPVITAGNYYENLAIAGSLSLVGDPSTQQLFDQLAHSSEGSIKFYYRDMVGMLRKQPRSRRCMMGYYSFVLEANGDVHPCVNAEEITFGNLLHDRFQEIWCGPRAEQLRQQLHRDHCPVCPAMCYNKPVNAGEVINLIFSKGRKFLSDSHSR